MRYPHFLMFTLLALPLPFLTGCATTVLGSESGKISAHTGQAPHESNTSQAAAKLAERPNWDSSGSKIIGGIFRTRSNEERRKYVEEISNDFPTAAEARWSCPIFAGAK